MAKGAAKEALEREIARPVPTSDLRGEALSQIETLRALTVLSGAQRMALERAQTNLTEGDALAFDTGQADPLRERKRRLRYAAILVSLRSLDRPGFAARVWDYSTTHTVTGEDVTVTGKETPIEMVPALAKDALSKGKEVLSQADLGGLVLKIAAVYFLAKALEGVGVAKVTRG